MTHRGNVRKHAEAFSNPCWPLLWSRIQIRWTTSPIQEMESFGFLTWWKLCIVQAYFYQFSKWTIRKLSNSIVQTASMWRYLKVGGPDSGLPNLKVDCVTKTEWFWNNRLSVQLVKSGRSFWKEAAAVKNINYDVQVLPKWTVKRANLENGQKDHQSERLKRQSKWTILQGPNLKTFLYCSAAMKSRIQSFV